MKVEKDFEEFIELLNQNNVEYMIVGTYALAVFMQVRAIPEILIFLSHEIN